MPRVPGAGNCTGECHHLQFQFLQTQVITFFEFSTQPFVVKMPFRRRRMRRRTRRRRNGRNTTRGIALRALRATDQELGILDFSQDTTPCPLVLNSVGRLLNGIQNGTLVNRRAGLNSLMVSLHVQLSFHRNVNAPVAQTSFIYWAVVRDKQSNQALPNTLEVWDSIQGVDNVTATQPLRNEENKLRFNVLLQGKVCMTFDKGCMNVTRFKKLNFNTRYTDDGAAIGDIASNAILFFTWASIPDANLAPVYNISARLRFHS